MLDEFVSENKHSTPQIWKLPFEFYEYARQHEWDKSYKRPYLIDLLYFEWIEIEVHTMPDIQQNDITTNGDFLKDIIVINPEHRLIRMNYPVHNKKYEKLESFYGNYYLLVYREPITGIVKFIELHEMLAIVFEQLKEENNNTKDILTEAGNIFGVNDENIMIENGIKFFQDFTEKGIIMGFRQKKY
jgi:hypothetical protein